MTATAQQTVQITHALTLDMETYINLAKQLSPEVSICVHGRAGIGKSEAVHQIAAELRSEFYKDPNNCKETVKSLFPETPAREWTYDQGIPVIMRRLSQLTEGDMTGLPVMTGRGTTFKPCDWFLDACKFPCILFLDERNRALEGVKQAVFEVQDSRGFYGHKLHPETRVYIAENVGDQYNVQQLDPAEVSRVALINLDPTVKNWLDWAGDPNQGDLHPAVVEYIQANESSLEFTGNMEPGKKYPDRRAWAKLARELVKSGLMDKPENVVFYHMTGAMIGPESAAKFWAFCKDRDRQVSAEDIMKNWEKAKKKLGGTHIPQEKFVELAFKLGEVLKKTEPSKTQMAQIAAFMTDTPPEVRMRVWTDAAGNMRNLFNLHPLVTDLVIRTATSPAVPVIPDPPKTKKV